MSVFVHGDNLEQKEKHLTKYQDKLSKQYLGEVRNKYDMWKNANLYLKGPLKEQNNNDIQIIEERVRLFNEYKDFLDQQKYAEKFDSRSNLHSSALEEFMLMLYGICLIQFESILLLIGMEKLQMG